MSKIKKKVVESSTFNLLNVYSSFFLGLFTTYMISRLLSPEEWGFLILALLFISYTIYICSFLPPGAEGSLYYYIPQYKNTEGEESFKIRGFIFHVYKIRLIYSFFIFISFLTIFTIFKFGNPLQQIIMIIAPTIILGVIQNLNIAIFLAFQKFLFNFLCGFINSLVYLISIFVIYLFNFKEPIILISYSYLFTFIITMVISTIFLIPLIPKKNYENSSSIPKKSVKFLDIHKEYGIYLTLASFLSQTSGIIKNILLSNFGSITYITYLSICEKSVTYTLNFSGSNKIAYIPIFSEINYQKNPEHFKKVFYQLSKYLSMIICILTAFFFFFMELYFTIIYPQIYLFLLTTVQIYLFNSFLNFISRNLLLLINSTGFSKINTLYNLFQMIFVNIFTLIGLFFSNFFVLVVFYILSSLLLIFSTIIVINRKIKFNLSYVKLFKPLIMYIVSLTLTLPITIFFNFQFSLNNILNMILNSSIKFLIFIVILYMIIYLSKYITREEFNQIIEVIPLINGSNRTIHKITKKVEKIFPTKKNISD